MADAEHTHLYETRTLSANFFRNAYHANAERAVYFCYFYLVYFFAQKVNAIHLTINKAAIKKF